MPGQAGRVGCRLSSISPALLVFPRLSLFASPVTSQTRRDESPAQNVKASEEGHADAGETPPPGRASPGASLPGSALRHVGPAPWSGSASSAALAVVEAGFPRLCNSTSRARRGLGSASLLGLAPGLRRPSHGLDGGGGERRGPRYALGAHAPVRPPAGAAGRAVRGPGQLRRRAGLARPRGATFKQLAGCSSHRKIC